VADQSYNGSFAVTSTGSNTLTYSQAGANSTSTGGTVAKLTGGYVLYPMAEVLGVFDTTTSSVDGQLTLAANTVAWSANDPVEEPHYYQELVSADVSFVGQTTPRPTIAQTAGIEYQDNVGPAVSGWTIDNAAPATNYFGNGGTHTAPHAAFEVEGTWQESMEMQAGEQDVFAVHCNSHGCGRWNSGYNLFALDNTAGVDVVTYQPQTSTLAMNLRGTAYQFSPQAFTAGTINAGTVNATTLNGAVSAAQLPLFQGSGSGHAQGAVPDPGASAGTARYLREDGTWSVPAGSGSAGAQSVGVGMSGGAAPLAGASADYNFLQGSGTVLTDNSGNGNNGALGAGALAPTWTPTGLSFSGQQQVALPSALNNSETFLMAVYLQPIGTSIPVNSFPMLVGSSLGGGGLNLLYDYETQGTLSQDTYVLAPTIYGNNAVFTGAKTMVSGFHVLAYVLGNPGGAADRIYIDGVEASSYDIFHFTSAGLQTSGNLFLGSSNTGLFGTSGLNGTFYRMVTFPTNTLTADQIQRYSNQVRDDVASRGVNTFPAQIPQATPTLHCIGDSITAGLGTSNPFCSLLSLTNQPAYQIINWGIPSVRLQAIDSSEKNRVGPLCESEAGPSVALVSLGTNDFLSSVQSPASVISYLAGEVQTLKKAGCRVFVGTMLSRAGNDGAGGVYDATKDAYDSLILTNANIFGADGVIDFAANPLLGADGATSNTTIFQSDGIHPTQAGQQLMANAASNALNYHFGFNQMNPLVVTATSYTMQAGDGYITASPTANQTLTLPDCTGQSGAVYTLTNLQSTFTVGVVAGSSAQLINGRAIGTVVPVPANGSLTLRDVANAKTVSGCHWEM
jgi:trimeric autotransporter adhesin